MIIVNSYADAAPSVLSLIRDALPVLLGAAIAFLTTWWFSRRDERARNRGLGYALVLRVNDATQGILQLRKMLSKHLAEVGTPDVPYKWLVVEIPAGFSWRETVVFPPEELAVFARAERNEMLVKLGELSRLHNIVMSVAQEYAVRRQALQDKFQSVSDTHVVTSTHMQSAITGVHMAKLAPDIALVENLISQLLAMLEEGSKFAVQVSNEIGKEVREALRDRKFNLGLKVELDES